ncbi:MAG: Hsp20/alpha crystallin family protein [Usitatibacter sp.]
MTQGQASTPLVPPVDILEDAEGITLWADMPGVAKENLSVGVEGDTLTLDATVRLGETTRMQPVYAEVRVARFKRSFVLSRDLDTEKISADIRNGVLTVSVPKREQAKPRRIDVRLG